MNIVLKLFGIVFIALLLSGCAVFEKINAANPIPDDYGKEARSMGNPFAGMTKSSRAGSDMNMKNDATFEQWHDSQY